MFRKLSLAIMAIAMCFVSMAYGHYVGDDGYGHSIEFGDDNIKQAVVDKWNEYARRQREDIYTCLLNNGLANQDMINRHRNGEPVFFHDEDGVCQQFREILTIESNVTIHHAYIEGAFVIHEISVTDKDVADLTGLEHVRFLQKLYLKGNQISDLSALQDLPDLIHLSVGKNQITDLSPLANLAKIQVLYAGNNQISDISDLENLTKLKKLGLARNIGITDISAVSKLTNLELLNLSYCRVKDIEPLRGLTKLEIVSFLWNKNIQDASAIYETENGGLRNNSWERIDLRFNDLNEASLEALAEMRSEITANGGFVGTGGPAAPPIPKGKITTTWASLKRR